MSEKSIVAKVVLLHMVLSSVLTCIFSQRILAESQLSEETKIGPYTLTLLGNRHGAELSSSEKQCSLGWGAGLMLYFLMQDSNVQTFQDLYELINPHLKKQQPSISVFRSDLRRFHRQVNDSSQECFSLDFVKSVRGKGYQFTYDDGAGESQLESIAGLSFDTRKLNLYCGEVAEKNRIEITPKPFYLLHHIFQTLSFHPEFLFSASSLRGFLRSGSASASGLTHHLEAVKNLLTDCNVKLHRSDIGGDGFLFHIEGFNDEILEPNDFPTLNLTYWPFEKKLRYKGQMKQHSKASSILWYYLLPQAGQSYIDERSFESLMGVIKTDSVFKLLFRASGGQSFTDEVKKELYWHLNAWPEKKAARGILKGRLTDDKQLNNQAEFLKKSTEFYGSLFVCPFVFTIPSTPDARIEIPFLGIKSEDLSLNRLLAKMVLVPNRWIQLSEAEKKMLASFQTNVVQAAKKLENKKQRLKGLFLIEMAHDMGKLNL